MADRENFSVGVLQLEPFTVASAPPAAQHTNGMILVTNGAAGSPILAFSDGTDWLRSDTGAAIAAA